jgi:hypothetical protein
MRTLLFGKTVAIAAIFLFRLILISNGQEKLAYSAYPLELAVKQADTIFLGVFGPIPAPGGKEIVPIYSHVKVKILESYFGSTGAEIVVNYGVFPHEHLPANGERYIFFVRSHEKAMNVLKLVLPDAANIAKVKELIAKKVEPQ